METTFKNFIFENQEEDVVIIPDKYKYFINKGIASNVIIKTREWAHPKISIKNLIQQYNEHCGFGSSHKKIIKYENNEFTIFYIKDREIPYGHIVKMNIDEIFYELNDWWRRWISIYKSLG